MTPFVLLQKFEIHRRAFINESAILQLLPAQKVKSRLHLAYCIEDPFPFDRPLKQSTCIDPP